MSEQESSAVAAALAAAMRRFDPGLSDEQVARIAADIDAQNALGAALNPPRKPLRNGDEPATVFVVPD